jgi:RimJ/RimL family protein N-acetyltransferase
MAYPERVETDRLVLRRFEHADRGAFSAIWTDPAVRAALDPTGAFDPANAPERLAHHLGHWREHGFGLWAIEDRAGGEPLGWAGATHPTFVPDLAQEVEIGWTLRRAFWGRGLATEAADAAVDAAFTHLELERVVSLIAPDNRRSIAVAERLGMREDGRVQHAERGFELCVYALSGAVDAPR